MIKIYKYTKSEIIAKCPLDMEESFLLIVYGLLSDNCIDTGTNNPDTLKDALHYNVVESAKSDSMLQIVLRDKSDGGKFKVKIEFNVLA